jgi:hypothetical protein
MTQGAFQTTRGILVRGLSLDFTVNKVVEYGNLTGGKKQPHLFAVSPVEQGWVLLGVPANMTRYNFHNLACWFLGLSEDAERATDVVAVSTSNSDPERAYYLIPDNSADDAVFIGRREDGAGLRVDIPMGEVDVSPKRSRFTEPLLEFLRRQQVPESLLPGPDGFALTPARAVSIELEEYEP